MIYLGVDNNAQVVGIESALSGFNMDAKGDPETMRMMYANFLRNMIAEGVQPTLSPTLAWIEQAGVTVVSIAFARGSSKPYAYVLTDKIFVRRGATNRLATPADVLAFNATPRSRLLR